MQLQAHLDGNRRTEELQLPEVLNKAGVVIAHMDPDPDIDRLHIKVWCPDTERYICFQDCKYTDTISKLKKKIQELVDSDTMQSIDDMKVFFNGVELVDSDTMQSIDDDCILHCVGTASMPTTRVLKSSVELHQWRLLLAHNLKHPIKDKVIETELNPRPNPLLSRSWVQHKNLIT